MIASLTATVALAIGLPSIALGERIRERGERRLNRPPTHPPERTPHEQIQ